MPAITMTTLDPQLFYEEALVGNDITHAFGVADSCLGGFHAYLKATKGPEQVVTATEGAAIGLAAGYYLSTQQLAVAYMPDSGLTEALNPLQSLAAKEVFGIPMLLMIGQGERKVEHERAGYPLKGPRTLETLKAGEFPYEMMPETLEEATNAVARLARIAKEKNTPVALIVPNNRISSYIPERGYDVGVWQPTLVNVAKNTVRPIDWRSSRGGLTLSRGHAVRIILKRLYPSDMTISSVGEISREIYKVRKERNEDMSHSFLSIGAVGNTYPLAFGVHMGPHKGRVICVEGDGSFLMHLGNIAVLAAQASQKLIHVVLHSGTHYSTGDQPNPISTSNLLSLAGSLPYKQKFFVDSAEGMVQAFIKAKESTLIVAIVNQEVEKNLPRPSERPSELRDAFISHYPNY